MFVENDPCHHKPLNLLLILQQLPAAHPKVKMGRLLSQTELCSVHCLLYNFAEPFPNSSRHQNIRFYVLSHHLNGMHMHQLILGQIVYFLQRSEFLLPLREMM